MSNININLLKQNWKGLTLSVAIGISAVFLKNLTDSPVAESLVIALLIGIILRSFVKFNEDFISGFKYTPMLFIPVGVILYGAINLNFKTINTVNPLIIFLIFFIFMSNAALVFLFSTLFNINPKTSYLLTAGSAICGASAIAISSKAIEAEPDDVSNSLTAVFIAALIGIFLFLPFLISVFNLTAVDYSIMVGSLVQFTGFVREAVNNIPIPGADIAGLTKMALSVKAVRYLGLLILVPLFASFIKGKFYIPWYLWAFLAAGLIFTYAPPSMIKLIDAKKNLEPILNYMWSIAMAAIGLNANLKVLFSKTGIKALAVSLISFVLAAGLFLAVYIPMKGLIF